MEKKVAYRILADRLRDELKAGLYNDGAALPTEHQLAERDRLSRQTVRRALQELVADGSIYRIAGRGTFARLRETRFISDFASVDDLLTLAPLTRGEIVTPLKLRKDREAARALQSDGEVYTIALRRWQDEIPIGYTKIALSQEIGTLLLDQVAHYDLGDGVTTVISTIDRLHPGLIAATEQSVTARQLPAAIAKYFACAPGQNVLRIERAYLTAGNVPIEVAVNYLDPAHYTYRVRLNREMR